MLENFLGAPEIDGVLLGSDWGTQRDLHHVARHLAADDPAWGAARI